MRFRKAYLGSLVDSIEVDDRQVRIIDRTEILEQAALADGRMPRVHGFVCLLPKKRGEHLIPEDIGNTLALCGKAKVQ